MDLGELWFSPEDFPDLNYDDIYDALPRKAQAEIDEMDAHSQRMLYGGHKTAEVDIDDEIEGSAGFWSTVMALFAGIRSGDNKIPSWFPKSMLLPQEISTGRWVQSSPGHFASQSRLAAWGVFKRSDSTMVYGPVPKVDVAISSGRYPDAVYYIGSTPNVEAPLPPGDPFGSSGDDLSRTYTPQDHLGALWPSQYVVISEGEGMDQKSVVIGGPFGGSDIGGSDGGPEHQKGIAEAEAFAAAHPGSEIMEPESLSILYPPPIWRTGQKTTGHIQHKAGHEPYAPSGNWTYENAEASPGGATGIACTEPGCGWRRDINGAETGSSSWDPYNAMEAWQAHALEERNIEGHVAGHMHGSRRTAGWLAEGDDYRYEGDGFELLVQPGYDDPDGWEYAVFVDGEKTISGRVDSDQTVDDAKEIAEAVLYNEFGKTAARFAWETCLSRAHMTAKISQIAGRIKATNPHLPEGTIQRLAHDVVGLYPAVVG